MSRGMRSMFVLCAAVAVLSVIGFGQEAKMEMPRGLRGSYMKQAMAAEREMVSLADAMPQETYAWRPMEGVRSVAEAFLHPAAGNYLVLKTMGGALPEGVDPMKLETSTSDKKQIIDEIHKSYKAINMYIAGLKEADFDRHVTFFGQDMTVGDMIVGAVAHQHELLGQEIAYARMNKVVPPWTAERMKAKKDKM